MDLLQLQYFIAIAECQHITKAANLLRVSQPSLSNTLSRIENELGIKLFDRQGRNIVLNDNGKIVLKHAKNIFRELDNIHTELDELQAQNTNTVTIGSVDSVYVKDWLPAFIETYPDILIRHSIGSCATLEAQLLNGDIDFAITDSRTLPQECACHVMGTDEYVVLTPLTSKINSDSPQDFSLFREEPFICSPKTEDILRPIDMLSQEAGFTPNIIFEGGQDLLSRLQPLGYGNIVAFISRIARPEYRAQCEKFSRIVFLTNNCARYNVHIVWDPRRTLSHAAETLLSFVQHNTKQFCTLNDPPHDAITDVLLPL
ncbi:MAG: LysR family transcriptional regulator [Peptococcaceae bacterium]|nr:LysR family transcriptional regulator [Peptococcaceae bacterium]